MYVAKVGGREGYREREIHTIRGEVSTDHPLGQGCVNAKIGWTFIKWNICVFIILVFI